MQQGRRIVNFIEWASILALVPFIIIALYTRPSADDLFLYYDGHKQGWLEAYIHMYKSYSSRYGSLLPLYLITYSRFLLDHYMLVPWFLLFLLYLGIYSCLVQLNRIWHNNSIEKRLLHTGARLLLLLYLTVMPEPATGIYWVSSSITHVLPLILLLFSANFFLSGVQSSSNIPLKIFLSALFLFRCIGCNEMLSLYLVCLLATITVVLKMKKSLLFNSSLILLIVAITGGFLLFGGSGQQNRAGGFLLQSSILYAGGAAVLKYMLLLSNLFSNPFFWFCIWGCTVLVRNGQITPRFRIPVLIWLLYYVALPFIFYFLVYLVNPSGVPERANNPLVFILLFSLILTTFQFAAHAPKRTIDFASVHSIGISICFVATLTFTKNYSAVIEGQVSGSIYSSILDNRIERIRASQSNNMKTVTLSGYEEDWNEYIKTKLPPILHKPAQKLLGPYPQSIHFCDDLKDVNWITSYAEYYGIDTINIGGIKHTRLGINPQAKEENAGFK